MKIKMKSCGNCEGIFLLDLLAIWSLCFTITSCSQCLDSQRLTWSVSYEGKKIPGADEDLFSDTTLEDCRNRCETQLESTGGRYTCRSIEYGLDGNCYLQGIADPALLLPDSSFNFYYIQCLDNNVPDSVEEETTIMVSEVHRIYAWFEIENEDVELPPLDYQDLVRQLWEAADETVEASLERFIVNEVDRTTGYIEFYITENNEDSLPSCVLIANIKSKLDTTEFYIEWGNSHWEVKDDSFRHDDSCGDLETDGDLEPDETYRAAFSLRHGPAQVLSDESDLFDSLESQLMNLAGMKASEQHRLDVFGYELNNGVIDFSITQNINDDTSSCEFIQRIRQQLQGGSQISIDGRWYNIEQFFSPNTCSGDFSQKIITVYITFHDRTFTNEYKNETTETYRELKIEVEAWVFNTLNKGALSEYLQEIGVTGYRKGSVVAIVAVTLRADAPSNSLEIALVEINSQLLADQGQIGGEPGDILTTPAALREEDDKILGLKPLYVGLIGGGIIIVLILMIAGLAVYCGRKTKTRRGDRKNDFGRHGSLGPSFYNDYKRGALTKEEY